MLVPEVLDHPEVQLAVVVVAQVGLAVRVQLLLVHLRSPVAQAVLVDLQVLLAQPLFMLVVVAAVLMAQLKLQTVLQAHHLEILVLVEVVSVVQVVPKLTQQSRANMEIEATALGEL